MVSTIYESSNSPILVGIIVFGGGVDCDALMFGWCYEHLRVISWVHIFFL
jgi:hypothetical protein